LDIIIDTDIGDDIDDALAVAFALNSPELNLIGVTTVFGQVEIRTKLALKLLKTFGRDDIPVATGIGKPIAEKKRTQIPNQAVVLKETDRLPNPSRLSAVDLILSTVLDSKDEVILAPIGALTNIAIAILQEPKLAQKAKIVLMGGTYLGTQAEEYNIRCDPEAARIVFESGAKITAVGLNVTLKCRLNKTQVQQIKERGTVVTSLLSDMISAWQGGKEVYPILHDPLAVGVAFDRSLVKIEPKLINVETRGEFTRGFTVTRNSDKPNAEVCVDVEAEKFVNLFMERIIKT
jgi:inosine-uridine nucleoside N-ribohydrolase